MDVLRGPPLLCCRCPQGSFVADGHGPCEPPFGLWLAHKRGPFPNTLYSGKKKTGRGTSNHSRSKQSSEMAFSALFEKPSQHDRSIPRLHATGQKISPHLVPAHCLQRKRPCPTARQKACPDAAKGRRQGLSTPGGPPLAPTAVSWSWIRHLSVPAALPSPRGQGAEAALRGQTP